MNEQKEQKFDFIILGAGPAGLQLGYYFEKAGLNYCLLEGTNSVASFFRKYPRKRSLLSFNKIYSIFDDPEVQLRWDWNSLLTDDYSHLFKEYSLEFYPNADELVSYLEDFAEKFVPGIEFNTRVEKISKGPEGLFQLSTQEGRLFRSTCLVVASGLSQPSRPHIPGIELVTEAYENVKLNPDEYKDERVLIIGKGNSGFEIANHLLPTASIIHIAGPEPLKFAWNTRYAGNLRANYMGILDTYQLKLLNSVLDCQIQKIWKEEDHFIVQLAYTHAEGEVDELIYDRVISCTGFSFDAQIFDSSIQPTLIKQKIPNLTSSWESSNIKNLYFAGALMQFRDFQNAGSAFLHGFRYNIRTLSRLLEQAFQGTPLPFQEIQATTSHLLDASLRRINTSSGLWTQFQYLSDMILLGPEQHMASYYEELPIDYIQEHYGKGQHCYYTLSFEWGESGQNVFEANRKPNHQEAHQSAFLHPVIRFFNKKGLAQEHHMLEDLFGTFGVNMPSGMVHKRNGERADNYHAREHDEPLRDFFEQTLAEVFQSSPEKSINSRE